MWTIYTNVSITRRKSYFMVTDPDGIVCFRHRHFWPCVDFLAAEGQQEYLLRPAEHSEANGAFLIVQSRR